MFQIIKIQGYKFPNSHFVFQFLDQTSFYGDPPSWRTSFSGPAVIVKTRTKPPREEPRPSARVLDVEVTATTEPQLPEKVEEGTHIFDAQARVKSAGHNVMAQTTSVQRLKKGKKCPKKGETVPSDMSTFS